MSAGSDSCKTEYEFLLEAYTHIYIIRIYSMPHRVTQTESIAFTSPCTLHSTHTDMNSMDCLTVFFCPANQVIETELC